MLSARRVMYPLLREHLVEAVEVAPAVDADAITSLPLVTFQTRLGAAIAGVEPPIAWEASTDLNVFAETEDEAEAIASDLYDLFHTFNEPFREPLTGLVPGYAAVQEVVDRAPFDLIARAAIEGRSVVQYSGGFDHQIVAE